MMVGLVIGALATFDRRAVAAGIAGLVVANDARANAGARALSALLRKELS
jgi:hypothetical protein